MQVFRVLKTQVYDNEDDINKIKGLKFNNLNNFILI